MTKPDYSESLKSDLLRHMCMAADTAAIDSRRAGDVPVETTRKALRAAIDCAIGNGLIEITNPSSWPEWIAVDPPFDPARW